MLVIEKHPRPCILVPVQADDKRVVDAAKPVIGIRRIRGDDVVSIAQINQRIPYRKFPSAPAARSSIARVDEEKRLVRLRAIDDLEILAIGTVLARQKV